MTQSSVDQGWNEILAQIDAVRETRAIVRARSFAAVESIRAAHATVNALVVVNPDCLHLFGLTAQEIKDLM
jgi:hypothetical protein